MTNKAGLRTIYEAFEACTLPIGGEGHPKRAVKATCGYCSNTETLPINTHKGKYGSDEEIVERLVAEKFETIGWLIGKTASQHRCPSCYAAIKASRKRKSEMKNSASEPAITEASSKIVQMPVLNIPPSPPVQEPVPAQSGTKQPTRDERRIIFQKLNEVYVGEETGYSAGWSDKRIAADLGVPMAWIKIIRDENFGPNIDEAMVTLINEAKAVLIEIQAAKLDADKIATQIKELNRKADGIEQRLKKVEQSK